MTTNNHGYNTPPAGKTNWHIPLNTNFEDLDRDVEIRDTRANRSKYAPVAGALFRATDTHERFLGMGGSWKPLGSYSDWVRDVDASGHALSGLESIETKDETDAITKFAGKNLAIDSNGVLNASGLGGGAWTFHDRKTFSSVSSVTFGTLPNRSHWFIFVRMKDASGSRKGPALQVNGDTGSNYLRWNEDGTRTTGLKNYRWANWGTERDDVTASLIGINGVWSSHCGGRIIIPGSDYSSRVGFRNGSVTSPLSSITLLQDQRGSISGEAELYYLDVQS